MLAGSAAAPGLSPAATKAPAATKTEAGAWSSAHTIGLVVLMAIVVGWAIWAHFCDKTAGASQLWGWLSFVALFVAFAALIGDGIGGRLLALLIDGRNRMSLSCT